MKTILALLTCVALCGCATMQSAGNRVGKPPMTVITERGDVISRDSDGNTTVTLAPIHFQTSGLSVKKYTPLEK